MTYPTVLDPLATIAKQDSIQPTNFLNGYKICNPSQLTWSVSLYRVNRTDGQQQTQEDRGPIKDVIWTLYKQYRERCRGFVFVIDVNEHLVAVPATWDLPAPIEVKGYYVTQERTCTASVYEPGDQPIITGIIREGVKKHFKGNNAKELGPLWQNYNEFCQMPKESVEGKYLLCRRFGVVPKVLCNNQWVLELLVNTATLDVKTLGDYYDHGDSVYLLP